MNMRTGREQLAISDLFPDTMPEAIPALWPTGGTRAYEALIALLQSPQNQAEYKNGWRLSAYVKALEYLGWSFIKRDIEHAGCRRPITEYRLDRTCPRTTAGIAKQRTQNIH